MHPILLLTSTQSNAFDRAIQAALHLGCVMFSNEKILIFCEEVNLIREQVWSVVNAVLQAKVYIKWVSSERSDVTDSWNSWNFMLQVNDKAFPKRGKINGKKVNKLNCY